MQPDGPGSRLLAFPVTPAACRSALCCMLISAALTLAGCETLSFPRLSATNTPEEIAGLALRADRAYRGEDWPAAEAGYLRMTEIAPDDAEHWFRLGNIYAHQSRLGEAVRMYGEALARDESHLGAWHNLGMTQMQLAARSFAHLEGKAPADDPARERARRIIDGVTELLQSERDAGQAADE